MTEEIAACIAADLEDAEVQIVNCPSLRSNCGDTERSGDREDTGGKNSPPMDLAVNYMTK